MSNESYSSLAETELFESLIHVLSGSAEDHRRRRIRGLEELQRRLQSDSLQDIDLCIDTLLKMSINQGRSMPVSSLIVNCFLLLTTRHENAFQKILKNLKGQEGKLFIVFSSFASKLEDYEKKKLAITPLMNFIVSQGNINGVGVKETYDCLVNLGNQRLSNEIVKQFSQHLDSLNICAVLFSVRLCSKFADQSLLPRMHRVLKNSIMGYFDAHTPHIERDLCAFFQRIRDQSSLFPLIDLLKARSDQNRSDISKAIGSILDAHPYRIDDVLDKLYDAGREKKLVDAILWCFDEMVTATVDAHKLLSKIRTKYWIDSPTNYYVQSILVKGGKSSKPALLQILRDNENQEKHDFAMRCLRIIGVSNEELSQIFPKPPMLQIYNFLYSMSRSRKIPRDLNALWAEKKKLGENIRGVTNRLEHLLLSIFSSFNFVTLNVAPLKLESVDIVCFHPETSHLLVVGCTTGVLKDDLAKMDALVNRMETEMPELFDICTLTPVVVCSEIATISPSDANFSFEQGIAVLEPRDIDKLLEMLDTNRQSRQAISYIEECKLRHTSSLPDY